MFKVACGYWVVALGLAACSLSCGSTSSGGATTGSAGTGATGGNSGGGSSPTGTAGQANGAGGSAAGAGSKPADVTAAQACRDYYAAVCTRIRACNAPTFRPCESPIDACPQSLFAGGSSWTIEEAVACTEAWRTHSCDALTRDEGPSCSRNVGQRPDAAACIFDVQCQSGRCVGGIVPQYNPTCGSCVAVVASHGACDTDHLCPGTETCSGGTCVDPPPPARSCELSPCPDGQVCNYGTCRVPIPLGGACTATTVCAMGLDCQIELVAADADEPKMGTCQALPKIGTACLPTFGHLGACEAGGTCNNRPTGDCVPLVEIGQACGYTQCVAGAYCNVLGYDNGLPTHTCYARGDVGASCDYQSSDHGQAACAEGLDCGCADASCQSGTCVKPGTQGQSCGPTAPCARGYTCAAGACQVAPNATPNPGTTAAGGACMRQSKLGREFSVCQTGLDCLCPDAACAAPLCATPRTTGESCDSTTQICRQGLICVEGKCAEDSSRDLESLSCGAKP